MKSKIALVEWVKSHFENEGEREEEILLKKSLQMWSKRFMLKLNFD
jgi:hypothetical protein